MGVFTLNTIEIDMENIGFHEIRVGNTGAGEHTCLHIRIPERTILNRRKIEETNAEK
jgi:hypothetical protein